MLLIHMHVFPEIEAFLMHLQVCIEGILLYAVFSNCFFSFLFFFGLVDFIKFIHVGTCSSGSFIHFPA